MSTEGWTWIIGSRKWHYFREGKSLCGKWGLLTEPHFEAGNDASPDNCAACRRVRVLEKAGSEQLPPKEKSDGD